MSEVKSYRKPYHPPVKATWWKENPFYVRYMLREGTAVLAFFCNLGNRPRHLPLCNVQSRQQ